MINEKDETKLSQSIIWLIRKNIIELKQQDFNTKEFGITSIFIDCVIVLL
jgi:hypothetical protein